MKRQIKINMIILLTLYTVRIFQVFLELYTEGLRRKYRLYFAEQLPLLNSQCVLDFFYTLTELFFQVFPQDRHCCHFFSFSFFFFFFFFADKENEDQINTAYSGKTSIQTKISVTLKSFLFSILGLYHPGSKSEMKALLGLVGCQVN